MELEKEQESEEEMKRGVGDEERRWVVMEE